MSTEAMRAALNRAFQLGQTYWQQADSDSYKQNAKSDVTREAFRTLVDETCAAIAQRADEPVAWVALLSVMLAQDLAEAKRLAGEALDKPRTAAPAAPAYVPLSDLQFVHSVLGDVLVDIADWEDRALADAVEDARARIESLVVARMKGST